MIHRQEQRQIENMAYLLMPDHLHWLFTLGDEKDLSIFMQSFKRYTSRKINIERTSTGPVWQAGFHDHAVRKEEDLKHIARYIVANPLRAKLVKSIKDYPHWDAVWL